MEQIITIEQVRKYSLTIFEAIHNLVKQLDKNYKPFSIQDMQNMLNSKDCFFFVARNSQNRTVGMITLIIYRIPYIKKGVLEDIVVDQKFRRQGIGTKLIETAVKKAKNEGAFVIDFTSRPTRLSANQLYKKLGFEQRKTNVYRLQL